jgi:hypothetical protein
MSSIGAIKDSDLSLLSHDKYKTNGFGNSASDYLCSVNPCMLGGVLGGGIGQITPSPQGCNAVCRVPMSCVKPYMSTGRDTSDLTIPVIRSTTFTAGP